MSIEQLLNRILSEDTPLLFADIEADGTRLKGSPFLVSTLVAELEAIRVQAGLTVDDLLAGLSEQRQQLYQERIQKQ